MFAQFKNEYCVFTTVVVDLPAAFELVFCAAIADGVNASEIAIVIAIRDLLPFIGHLVSFEGISV